MGSDCFVKEQRHLGVHLCANMNSNLKSIAGYWCLHQGADCKEEIVKVQWCKVFFLNLSHVSYLISGTAPQERCIDFKKGYGVDSSE